MTIAAIQNQIGDWLNGLLVPFESRPIQTVIIPPDFQTVDGPKVYIWTENASETRQAGPRQGELSAYPNYTGKYVTHEVNISVVNMYDPNTMKRSAPATMLETILQALRGNINAKQIEAPIEVPYQITDEVTGETSWITKIGEQMTFRQFPLVVMEDGSTYYAQAEIIVRVEEQRAG